MDQNKQLDNRQIREKISIHEYAGGYKPSKKLIDSIIKQFWFHNYYASYISLPHVLDSLIAYLGVKHPRSFNRCDFYKHLLDATTPDNLRQPLQQIGLSFEKLQRDALPIEEYKVLLAKLELEEILDPVVLAEHELAHIGERDGNELLIWSHHSITEYLTAELLLEREDLVSELEKYSVLKQDGVVAFKSSWVGVLSFLLESKEKKVVLYWIVSFLEANQDSINDDLADVLLYYTRRPSVDLKSRMFDLIYGYYHDHMIWMPIEARRSMRRFVGRTEYACLKRDVRDKSFVVRGNVAAIMAGLLKSKSKLITRTERAYWHKKLIRLAINPKDDGNGVVQRNSLSALRYVYEKGDISKVAKVCFDNTTDSLVRDEFLTYCAEVAPSSPESIDYMIKGVSGESTIYGRYGLYKMTSKAGIKYWLKQISTDKSFLKEFIDKESIFDKEQGDQVLYRMIEEKYDKTIEKYLKQMVRTMLSTIEFFSSTNSKFMKFLSETISNNDPEYLFEILDEVKEVEDGTKALSMFRRYSNFIACLLTTDNLSRYLEVVENLQPEVIMRKLDWIYKASFYGGSVGREVYARAVEIGVVPKKQEKVEDHWEKKRADETIQRFQKELNIGSKQYIPNVYKTYLQNRELVEKRWNKKEEERLIRLAKRWISRIDPLKFKVTFIDKGSSRFTWTSYAAYYGDIIRVIKILAPEEIEKKRQNIINFLPYAFSDDMSLIVETIADVTDKELTDVNKIMINEMNDARYLTPSSYVYAVGQYRQTGSKIPSVSGVLRSFIGDPRIESYKQYEALKALEPDIVRDKGDEDKEWLMKLDKDNRKNEDAIRLSEYANELLIRIYRDERAIEWRFQQVRISTPHTPPQSGEFHSVGPAERELSSMALAKPLIKLSDKKYLPKFIELLEYSFDIQEEYSGNKLYREYINYLWSIVIGYVDNLKEQRSFGPLLTIEEWLANHEGLENHNWLSARVQKLRRVYIDFIGTEKLS